MRQMIMQHLYTPCVSENLAFDINIYVDSTKNFCNVP